MRWTPWQKLGRKVLYGLLAALGWGTADLAAAISGRRIGSYLTAGIAQVTSLVVLLALALVLGQHFHARSSEAAVLLANGVLAAVAYIALYKSLEMGPVALVSPIVAAYAAISILLAMIFLHESMSGVAVAGATVTLGGAALTSTDIRLLRSGRRLFGGGVPWAFASMLLFGVATFIVGQYSQRIGWYSASLLSRLGNVAGVLAFVFLVRRSIPTRPHPKGVAVAALVGIADIAGVVTYARGAQLGLITVVSAASAAFILIPIAGGLVMFRERPAASQMAGVALVGLGLILLALG